MKGKQMGKGLERGLFSHLEASLYNLGFKPEGLPCSLSESVFTPGHHVQMVMVS